MLLLLPRTVVRDLRLWNWSLRQSVAWLGRPCERVIELQWNTLVMENYRSYKLYRRHVLAKYLLIIITNFRPNKIINETKPPT